MRIIPRRWLQFRLKWLLVFVAVPAMPLSWLGWKLEEKRRERWAVEKIERLGGVILDDGPMGCTGDESPPGPQWLRRILGDDFFVHAEIVALWESDGMMALNNDGLPITEPTITDDDVACLRYLPKLRGLVASFGRHEAPAEEARGLVYEDPFGGVYKKLLFCHDGTRLVGGVLVGDAADYGRLLALTKSGQPLPVPPGELILGKKDAAAGAGLDDACQVCSCNNVSKAQICRAIREQGLTDLGAVKGCTKAGTGCGGCLPLVSDLLAAELKAAGKAVSKRLCEHFAYT
ncbi:MAG TPA: (2Fe-2S)-binding protein, partial [Pirellulales bacterium]|nr:(2Fe-2S)-binding protein [Pirellulales bacterium]